MNNLYTGLAEVYEAMYQTFIDYEEEFLFYAGLLRRGNCHAMVEIGCGSGHLASRFANAGFQYTGLDLSPDMLQIAAQKHPNGAFIQADMRHFNLPKPVDGAVMTGRTISYLIQNQDVSDCFASVRRNLKTGGLFCFDFIDAGRFIPNIVEGEKITHRAAWGERQFSRDSYWKVNMEHGWGFDWKSIYYEEIAEGAIQIGEDDSTIRAFTKDEITLFLKLAGFKVMDCIDRPAYAFETYVMVAEAKD